MNSVFIVDAVRTPIGKYGGVLSYVRPDDMFALLIQALLERNPYLDPHDINEVIVGCTNQSGEDSRNVARMCVLLAGLPVDIPAVTVNRLCGSGMEAILIGYRLIKCGDADVVIVGGVESMSRAPFIIPKSETPFSRNITIYDSTIGWRFPNPRMAQLGYPPLSMGETAEILAEKYNISREEQDMFAYTSQMKCKRAYEEGKFKDEIIPVPVKTPKQEYIVDRDEPPRFNTTPEELSCLPPAFKKGGTVTAGNSCGINDGASALLLMSEQYIRKYGIKPMARIVGGATAGVHPNLMGTGPIPATLKLLKKTGLSINDIDLAEINEAFAVQVIVCMRELNINPEIVNVNGGAIALGHPLGASGSRITTTLVHEMKRRNAKTGLATMCIGIGQEISILIENTQ